MKVAVVARNVTSSKGGLEQYAKSLVRGLAARGHHVDVFAHSWDQPEEPGVGYCHVPVVRKPAWLQALTFHWGVNRRLALADYDVVLGSGVVLFSPQHLYRMSGGLVVEWLRLRYPRLITRILMMVIRPVFLVNWWLERRLMAGNVSYIIANSSRYRDQVMRQYGVPVDRVSVIYNGYDPNRFDDQPQPGSRQAFRRRHGMHDDAFVLLFVSQDFLRKGLDLLINTLPAVMRKNPRTWLIVVGRGTPTKFQQLARHHGIQRRVIFVGSTNTVEEYYAIADALVLPTRFDPFANVCLEAMACGLPVVTTRMNGASELIRDGGNGYVVEDPTDTATLADRICRLLDPAHRIALGREAARTARHFTLDRHVDEIEQLFSRIQEEEAPARILRASLRRLVPDLVVHGDYLELLEHYGLTSFETLMGYDEGVLVKSRKGKRIFQLRVDWKGQPMVLYLKRHRLTLSWRQRAMHRFGRGPVTEGRKEWENILAFHDRQLPTMIPVAMGERIVGGAIQESFVITRGLVEYESLEQVAPKKFVGPLTKEVIREKRLLICKIAKLTERMHWAGMFHRDYNLVHVLLGKGSEANPNIRLIDLQRVLVHPWLRHRWLIKDIATMYYHLQYIVPGHPLFTRTDTLRFLRVYRAAWMHDRRLMRAVQRKAKRIAHHALRSAH